MKIYKIVPLVITFIYSSSFIFSQDYYVSDNLGSDSNSGTLSSPFKTINFGKGVNFSAGLPIIRTSPDHGTAYDIAGKGLADPTSFIKALEIASNIYFARNNLISK